MKNKISLMGLATLVVSLTMVSSVSAWGPSRQTYTMEDAATSATFNSITDNPAVGDERDFVRIVEKDTGDEYTSDLELVAGKQYEVYIYFHNDALSKYNTKDYNYVGVARETRLTTTFPDELAKGERGRVFAQISSTTTTPAEVWDDAYVTAKEAMTLHYVTGSAKMHNQWQTNGAIVSTNMFGETGTYIGLASVNDDISAMNGVIPGCHDYSGSITYTIQTMAVTNNTPDDPDAPVTPDEPDVPDEPTQPSVTPEVPKELPKTGPIEIILAVIVIGAIMAAVLYWHKTHKEVKKVSRKAKGKK